MNNQYSPAGKNMVIPLIQGHFKIQFFGGQAFLVITGLVFNGTGDAGFDFAF